MTRPGRPAAVILLVAALLAACGGEDHRTAGTRRTDGARPGRVDGGDPTASPSTTLAGAPRQRGSGPAPDGAGQATARASLPAAAQPGRYTRVRVSVDSSSSWMTFDLSVPLVRGAVVSSSTADVVWRAQGFSVAPRAGLTPRSGPAPRAAAVVDLVFRLRDHPTERAELCAGRPGDVVLRMERRTTSAAPLLDQRRPATGPACVSTPMSRADLAGPVAWPRPVDPTRRVLAFYYPWYTSETFSSGNWPERPLAPWDTEDPDAVAQTVALAASGGIDGLLPSYSHDEPNDGRRLDRLFTAADARPGFSVAAVLEVEHMRGSGLAGAVTDADLERWMRAVLSRAHHPSQLRVGDRPVVLIYGMGRVTPETWAAARARFRAAGEDPFVLADTTSVAHQTEGIYQYNPNVAASPDLARWYGALEEAARLDPAAPQRLWAAAVSPGEDDTAAPRPESQKRRVPRRDGARYLETWRAAVATTPDWVLVTSWNEWFEATAVAPSVEAGDRYLRLTLDEGLRYRAS